MFSCNGANGHRPTQLKIEKLLCNKTDNVPADKQVNTFYMSERRTAGWMRLKAADGRKLMVSFLSA